CPPVPTSDRPLRSSCEHPFHSTHCDARAWSLLCREANALIYRYFCRFCNASLPEPEKRIRAGTIHFAVRVGLSVSITGIAHQSVADLSPSTGRITAPCRHANIFHPSL